MPVLSVQVVNHTVANVAAIVADARSVSAGDISLSGVTYSQIQNSLGSDVYNSYMIYLNSSNSSQVTNPLSFFIYDVNGNKKYQSLIPVKDPYQNNNAIFFNPPEGVVVFNGNSGLSFNIEPLTSVRMQFFSVRVSNQGNAHAINFLELEKRMNVPNFFEYKTSI